MQQGDLSKDIEQLLNPVNTKKCAVGLIFDDLESDNDRESLTALLASPVSNAKITVLLNRNNFKIGETAIWKHRSEACACVRSK